MASKERSGSIMSGIDEDLNKVSMVARDTAKDPIKISFKNIDYKIRVRSAPEERRLTG
jgi:hypothetical protein